MARVGMEPIFPLWGRPTADLAREMSAGGLRARLVCLDPTKVPRELAGREFDDSLLAALPEGVDPCGENGEFHSFCHALPDFAAPIAVETGEVVEREGFVFADVLPLNARAEV
jgi:diphthamide synthase (EF-2-diphthine--ammonia ligase)